MVRHGYVVMPLTHTRPTLRHSKRATLLPLGALFALNFCRALPSGAQDVRAGRLEGRVIDSARVRPPIGTRVVARAVDPRVETTRTTETDSAGSYRIDALPPGRYVVGFDNPLLDSLEITLAPREVTIAEGLTATLDLAIPPAAKLRSVVCSGAALPPHKGVIYGQVVDPETENPMSGVMLVLSWRELDFDRATLRSENRPRVASDTTDASGWYRVCGVPTDTWMSLQLQHRGRVGPIIRALVGDRLGILIRHLSFSAQASHPARESATSPTDSGATALLSGTAVLGGIVRGIGGLPLAAAEVAVRGTSAVGRTDAAGRYSLHGLPAGTQVLDVRHVGYIAAEVPVELRSGRTVVNDVLLQRVVNLDSIRVVAKTERYSEFNDHRKTAIFGVFLDPERMEREHVPYTSDVIEKIPGFRIVGDGIKAQVYGNRGGSFCGKVNVVVDGLPKQSINDVNPLMIGAIEAYREGEPGPPEYSDARACGMIVIWTKR